MPFDRPKSVFTIRPSSGTLKAGQKERFVVEFRPRQLKAVPIELSGKGQLPPIHFSLPEEGSYVENKQVVKLTQENEIENVIEINPIERGLKVLFNLWVLNPTKVGFLFDP